jgi:hypothetical protein
LAKNIPTNNGDEKLDALARSLAEPMPRRRALRLLVAGFFGLVVTSGRPKRADAKGQGCGPRPKITYCSKGTVCGTEGLPNKWGQTGCIKHCCYDENNGVCCAGKVDVHGNAKGNCCNKGFTCGGDSGELCICNGTIDSKTGFCDCPPERVCGSGCCKEGAQYLECDCSKLKALQIELRNATHLQEAFRNKIPELRGKGKDSSQSAFETFAKGEARRGLESIPGYKGPLYVEYYPWGRGLSEDADRSMYKPAELCRMIDSSAKDLTEAKKASACAGIGAALQAHENWHISFCTTIGFLPYEEMHGADRAQEEVEAYGAQIKVLRDILDHLGCS